MTDSNDQKGVWAGRRFTRAQLLKRDIRSAATRSEKSAAKPTLVKLKCLEDAAHGEKPTADADRDYLMTE